MAGPLYPGVMGPPSPSSSGAEPAGTRDLGPVGQRIAAFAIRLVGGRRARLYCRLEPTDAITCVSAAGDDDPGAPADADLAVGERALRENRAILTADVLTEPGLSLEPGARERIARGGAAAFAAVPVRADGAGVGALVLADRPGRRFTAEEVALLSACADQMAVAIEHARMHAELARQRDEARELARVAHLVSETLDVAMVGKRIAESVLDLLGVHSSAIRLFRPDGALGAIALGGRARDYDGLGDVVPVGVGLVGRAAAEGQIGRAHV